MIWFITTRHAYPFSIRYTGAMQPMVIISYWQWHYTTALRSLFVLWRDLTWYVLHLFSVPFLLRTLFAPWKRMSEHYDGGGLEGYFGVLAFNLASRFVGCTIRLPIILVGLLVTTLMVVALVGLYVAWLLAPLVIVGSFMFGSALLYG